MATAVSKIISIKRTLLVILKICTGELAKAIKIWPAVILAANRIERVMGRIICLISSINTINWDKGKGVPIGTRWVINWFEFWNSLNKIMLNQIGKTIRRVKSKWAVIVNT